MRKSSFWLVALLVASCVSQVCAQVQPRKYVLNNVPQYYQGKVECGPVAMRMVLAYYGINLSKSEIKGSVGTTSVGTRPTDMLIYVQSTGLKFDERSGTIDDIAMHIAMGHPVLVHQWKTMEAKQFGQVSHFRVVIGYDYDTQTIYMRDPSRSGLSSISFQEFNTLWEVKTGRGGCSTKNWMMAIYK